MIRARTSRCELVGIVVSDDPHFREMIDAHIVVRLNDDDAHEFEFTVFQARKLYKRLGHELAVAAEEWQV